MSKYFIDRPVFAWVIAIVIMLAGGLSIMALPIEQYPSIAPPVGPHQRDYPGASAQTVEGTVTQVIEQQMNGLDHLRYISSNSDSSGTAQITLTFNPEADPGHRPGAGAEQAPARHAAPAAGSAAAGRAGDQGHQHLPDGHRLRLQRRHHRPERHRRLRRVQHPGPDQPRDRASAPSRCSAPSTPCGSGWTRTS